MLDVVVCLICLRACFFVGFSCLLAQSVALICVCACVAERMGVGIMRLLGESVNRRWSLVLTLCKCPLGPPFWLKWALPFFLGI